MEDTTFRVMPGHQILYASFFFFVMWQTASSFSITVSASLITSLTMGPASPPWAQHHHHHGPSIISTMGPASLAPWDQHHQHHGPSIISTTRPASTSWAQHQHHGPSIGTMGPESASWAQHQHHGPSISSISDYKLKFLKPMS